MLHKNVSIDPPTARRKLLYAAIERGLDKERNPMWNQSTLGEDAKEAFPISGSHWLEEETMSREQQTLLARFPVGNIYMGLIQLPRDDVNAVLCPICGYELNRMPIIEECRGLEVERLRLEEAIPSEFSLDLFWLAWQGRGPFNTFLLAVRDRFIEAGRIGAGSTQSV